MPVSGRAVEQPGSSWRPRVFYTIDDRFLVPDAGGRSHLLRLGDGGQWVCTCEAGRRRGRCPAMLAVEAFLDGEVRAFIRGWRP